MANDQDKVGLHRGKDSNKNVGSATVPTVLAGAVACPTKDRQSLFDIDSLRA
jgi:hypothetical protein